MGGGKCKRKEVEIEQDGDYVLFGLYNSRGKLCASAEVIRREVEAKNVEIEDFMISYGIGRWKRGSRLIKAIVGWAEKEGVASLTGDFGSPLGRKSKARRFFEKHGFEVGEDNTIRRNIESGFKKETL